ncbi:MAG: UbiX family flavin prenyltransferase [Thermoleophilia bacterium]
MKETGQIGEGRRVVVGISGASGTIYGVRLLEVLRDAGIETHLILTEAARRVIETELDSDPDEVTALAAFVHADDDPAAPISSGSFRTEGMAVLPCSIKSLSAVAVSYNDSLLARAADVTLKERRPLVLAVRETPLHLGHLKLMVRAAECGAVILPPVPAFYHRPQTIQDLVDHTVGKVMECLGLDHDLYRRWCS